MRVMDVIHVFKIVLLSQNGLVHEESSRSQTHDFGERCVKACVMCNSRIT